MFLRLNCCFFSTNRRRSRNGSSCCNMEFVQVHWPQSWWCRSSNSSSERMEDQFSKYLWNNEVSTNIDFRFQTLFNLCDCAVLCVLDKNCWHLLCSDSDAELVSLFTGFGYLVRIVSDPDIDADMAVSMEWALNEIRNIQRAAREGRPIFQPKWPLLIMKTPKGWTGIKWDHQGNPIEGTFFRWHKVLCFLFCCWIVMKRKENVQTFVPMISFVEFVILCFGIFFCCWLLLFSEHFPFLSFIANLLLDEGSYRSHQIPVTDAKWNYESFKLVNDWLYSYFIRDLIDHEGKFHQGILDNVLPRVRFSNLLSTSSGFRFHWHQVYVCVCVFSLVSISVWEKNGNEQVHKSHHYSIDIAKCSWLRCACSRWERHSQSLSNWSGRKVPTRSDSKVSSISIKWLNNWKCLTCLELSRTTSSLCCSLV